MSPPRIRGRPGLWGGLFFLLLGAGALSSFVAIVKGVCITSTLDDAIPWGLCVGLDVFCGIALATGALWVAAVARASGLDSWRSARAASLCIAVAAYVVAILGSMASLGQEQNTWPAMLQLWSPLSVISGAMWTLLLLLVLLLLEFLPILSRASPNEWWLQPVRHLQVALLIGTAVIASMHQVGITRVISLGQGRFLPLWSGPSLALEFFISSLSGALAVLLFSSWRSLIAFGKRIPAVIGEGVARLLTITVFLYLVLRLTDLGERRLGRAMFTGSRESTLLWLELGLFLLGMAWVSARESSPKRLYYGSAMIMAGVVANRLNTCITALESSAGRSYQPNWMEIAIAYSLVAVGTAMFAVCVKHLPVFVDATERG